MAAEEDTQGKTETERDMTMLSRSLVTAEDISTSSASLVVLAGWEIGREFALYAGEAIIGRSPVLAMRISEPSVSRHHAKIERKDGETGAYYEICDLNSSNGILVNGESVTSSTLRDGDRIQLGDVILKFVTHDSHEGQYHREVHRMINHDELTGLLKMDAFRRHLDTHIATGTPFVLAMTDLDGLKKVNDTHGHLAGRTVVREMGAMIRQCLRPQDYGGLYGGDEAILLFPACTFAEARNVAENLRKTVQEREFQFGGHTFGVTICQGLAEFPNHGDSAETIIAAADRALYDAKRAGRNCVKEAGG
jgi:diguanylate cyclase (GGDEF)-like protein